MPEATQKAIRAMLLGILVTGGPFMLLTVPIGLAILFGDGRPEGIAFAAMPLLVAGVGVVPASVLIGLPLTALYRHLRCESVFLYAWSGLATGIVAPGLLMFALEGQSGLGLGILLYPLGAFAGLLTADSWGRWRVEQAEAERDSDDELRPRRGREKFLS